MDARVRRTGPVGRAEASSLVRGLEQGAELESRERGGDGAEHRQRREASADLRIAEEDAPEVAALGELDQRAPGVGDRREVRSSRPGPERLLGPGQEVAGERLRLHRASRLGRHDEQRPL
jgi:hypothetical protein